MKTYADVAVLMSAILDSLFTDTASDYLDE